MYQKGRNIRNTRVVSKFQGSSLQKKHGISVTTSLLPRYENALPKPATTDSVNDLIDGAGYAPNWITHWITIQDFIRLLLKFSQLTSQTPTVLWTVGLPLMSASFHHSALSQVSQIDVAKPMSLLCFCICRWMKFLVLSSPLPPLVPSSKEVQTLQRGNATRNDLHKAPNGPTALRPSPQCPRASNSASGANLKADSACHGADIGHS